MKTKKENRDRLFKRGRPVIREFATEDLKWLLASATKDGDIVDDHYRSIMIESIGEYDEVYAVEDINNNFSHGAGIVAVIGCVRNEYVSEPHIQFLEWSSTRNKLAAVVSFMHKSKHAKLNVMKLNANQETCGLLSKVGRDYLPLKFGCRIPNGNEFGNGDEYIYYMQCRGVS